MDMRYAGLKLLETCFAQDARLQVVKVRRTVSAASCVEGDLNCDSCVTADLRRVR